MNIYVAGKNFAPSVNAAKAMQQASKQESDFLPSFGSLIFY